MSLSVIVITYNGKSTIIQTLKSIYDQKENDEIIVVDDCSTDNSVKLIKKYFPNVKVIENRKNMYPAYCRNLGIRKSHGDYILFIDDDVFLPPNSIKKMKEEIKDADIVYPKIVFDNGVLMYPHPDRPSESKYILASTVFMIKRSSLKKLDEAFDETYQFYFEDVDFFLRCRLFGLKAKYISDITAIHSTKNVQRKLEEKFYFTIRNVIYGHMKLSGLDTLGMFKNITQFLLVKFFINCLFNYSFRERYQSSIGNKSLKYKIHLLLHHKKITERSRAYLIYLYLKAIFWNIKNLRFIIKKRNSLLNKLDKT